MTFRVIGPWYASLIALWLPLVACSSSELPSGDDGVIVRNCGPFGALLSLFEAKADVPFAFLNGTNS